MPYSYDFLMIVTCLPCDMTRTISEYSSSPLGAAEYSASHIYKISKNLNKMWYIGKSARGQ